MTESTWAGVAEVTVFRERVCGIGPLDETTLVWAGMAEVTVVWRMWGS